MSGISTLINSTAGAINGYRDQTYQQNAQDYLQQVRANDQLKMLAAQTTYQPQAQAQIAQAGLSQLQANSAAGLIPQESADAQLKMLAAQTTYQPQAQAQIAQAGLSQLQANSAASLIPQQTGVASTQLQTAQTAADGALQRQPAINQAAANQATVQAGVTGTQAQMLPQQQTDMQLQRAQADQQQHVSALTGLYTSMMEGPSAAKAYVQKVADSGAYPGLQGKQIGTVGLTSDGQNFAATDTQGNEVFQIPTSSIQSAFKMSRPTEWHEVKPGSTLIGTQGGNISTSTQAPVPDAFSNQHAGVTVNTANWLMKNVPNLKAQDAFNMAKQANTMSREQFVATIMGNPMLNTDMGNPAGSAQKFGQIYDQLRAQSSPGLSNAPASNTSGNSIIDSLIGGSNPAGSAANPYAPDPGQ